MSAEHEEIRTECSRGGPAGNWPWAQTPAAAVGEAPVLTRRRPLFLAGAEWDEADSPTLLCLIEAVGEVTEDDDEVVAAVSHMLSSGRVRFRGQL